MNQSDLLFKNLLSFGWEKINNFLKNTSLYKNQFSSSKFNFLCNEIMYRSIKPQITYPKRQDFYFSIPELEAECKTCWKYHIKPRNKSLKILDIKLGNLLENIFIDYMNTIGLRLKRADTKNKSYPDIMVLDSSKEIRAYIELKYHAAPFLMQYKKNPGRECYEGSLTIDKIKLEKQLQIIYSELDRPVLYVHWVDFPCIKGVFFQTSEQLNEYLNNTNEKFERKEREGDFIMTNGGKQKKWGYTEKIYPSMIEMGDFYNLISLIKKITNSKRD